MRQSRDVLDRRACRISRRIESPRLKLERLVRRGRDSPVATIRRSRVSTLQRSIHQKLDARNTDVVTRRRS